MAGGTRGGRIDQARGKIKELEGRLLKLEGQLKVLQGQTRQARGRARVLSRGLRAGVTAGREAFRRSRRG